MSEGQRWEIQGHKQYRNRADVPSHTDDEVDKTKPVSFTTN
jgi:hypothetical protein